MVLKKSLLKGASLPSTNQEVETVKHGEYHLEGRSSHLKTVIFGGLDGVLTMFAVVSGAAGASVTPKKLVSLSLGSLLASAFSMGYGEYVSSKAEYDFVSSEKAREEYEIENCPEVEQREMFEIYMNRYKFNKSDARNLVELSFKRRDFFLKHMMVEELGILLDDEYDSTPLKKSLLMGGSFGIMGMFPMLGYVFLVLFGNGEQERTFVTFLFTVLFSVFGAASLGYFKGKYLRQSKLWSALYMTFNGVVVGFTSYLLGFLLSLF